MMVVVRSGAKQKKHFGVPHFQIFFLDASASSLIHQFSSKINKGTSRFNSHLLNQRFSEKWGPREPHQEQVQAACCCKATK